MGTRFDLKGSVKGRTRLKGDATMNDPKRDLTVALKDNDFRYYVHDLKFEKSIVPSTRTVNEILAADARFLAD